MAFSGSTTVVPREKSASIQLSFNSWCKTFIGSEENNFSWIEKLKMYSSYLSSADSFRPRTDYTYARTTSYLKPSMAVNDDDVMPNLRRNPLYSSGSEVYSTQKTECLIWRARNNETESGVDSTYDTDQSYDNADVNVNRLSDNRISSSKSWSKEYGDDYAHITQSDLKNRRQFSTFSETTNYRHMKSSFWNTVQRLVSRFYQKYTVGLWYSICSCTYSLKSLLSKGLGSVERCVYWLWKCFWKSMPFLVLLMMLLFFWFVGFQKIPFEFKLPFQINFVPFTNDRVEKYDSGVMSRANDLDNVIQQMFTGSTPTVKEQLDSSDDLNLRIRSLEKRIVEIEERIVKPKAKDCNVNFMKALLKSVCPITKEWVEENFIRKGEHSIADDELISNRTYIEKLMKAVVEMDLEKYDSDKTAMLDFAHVAMGGRIVSTRCSKTYINNTYNARYPFFFGLFNRPVIPKPDRLLESDIMPGSCWPFQGSMGTFVIRLAAPIKPSAFTYEHIPRTITLFPDSAPKEIAVFSLRNENDFGSDCLLGRYRFDYKHHLQTFPVQIENPPLTQYIEVRIESNWGNPYYTCLYRFRVHGIV